MSNFFPPKIYEIFLIKQRLLISFKKAYFQPCIMWLCHWSWEGRRSVCSTNYVYFYNVIVDYSSVLYEMWKRCKYYHGKKTLDVLSQLNFFMQENLVSTAHFAELRDHRNKRWFSDTQTRRYVIDSFDNKETPWFIRSLTTLRFSWR